MEALCVTTHGKSRLMVACLHGDVETAAALVAQGADVNQAEKGVSPLYCACLRGHNAVASLLLDDCADANHTSQSGITCLFVASLGCAASPTCLFVAISHPPALLSSPPPPPSGARHDSLTALMCHRAVATRSVFPSCCSGVRA